MLRGLLLTYLCFFVFSLSAQVQEVISPIQWIPRGEKQSVKKPKDKTLGGTFNGDYLYKLDTLKLPLFDDFSSDKFQKYTAQPTDANVVTEHYVRMKDTFDVDKPWGTQYTDQQTYLYQVDTTAHTTDTIPLAPVYIKWNDLSVYPVTAYSMETAYPPYNIYDTTNYPNPIDTLWMVNFYYEQDTADMYIVTVTDSNAIWKDSKAYRNYTKAIDPWSLGVATFDGLDETGYPYAINTTYEDYADTLTSKVIDLAYPPGDSLYFTFLYQPQGYGDIPEAEDSLILQFYNVTLATWVHIWGVAGSATADFTEVHLPITQAAFLQNGFQFRFLNYGGLSGDLDNWHIDYVHLRRLSYAADTEIEDFSVVYPIPSLLEEFTAVPWEHFRNSPTGHMNSSLTVKVKNASNQVANSSDAAQISISYKGGFEGSYSYPGGQISAPDLDYFNNTIYSPSLDVSTGYQFDATKSNDTLADFDFFFKATEPTLTELSYNNDTTYGTQHFENYYAYDDWSAEAAYGITGAQALLAYQFTPYEADSLVGVQMHFLPTVYDQSTKIFLLTVWADDGGQPGEVLYQDDYFSPRSPYYEHERNQFHNYYFKDMQKVAVSGTFYVGWRQLDADKLNIGYDYNADHSSKLFISPTTGAAWINSSLTGTVMMRPVFSTKMDYQLGLPTYSSQTKEIELTLYPNPVQYSFSVETNVEYSSVVVYSLEGREMLRLDKATSYSLENLSQGVYMVHVLDKNNKGIAVKKIIKQ